MEIKGIRVVMVKRGGVKMGEGADENNLTSNISKIHKIHDTD
jgi:hypothetical protein